MIKGNIIRIFIGIIIYIERRYVAHISTFNPKLQNCTHLPEEFLEDPHEGIVILRSEDFSNEPASFDEKLRSQFDGVERQADLGVCIVQPILTWNSIKPVRLHR